MDGGIVVQSDGSFHVLEMDTVSGQEDQGFSYTPVFHNQDPQKNAAALPWTISEFFIVVRSLGYTEQQPLANLEHVKLTKNGEKTDGPTDIKTKFVQDGSSEWLPVGEFHFLYRC